ncbi:hypothetical protein ACWCZB_19715, partial [Streptomyces sp. NPDC001500]
MARPIRAPAPRHTLPLCQETARSPSEERKGRKMIQAYLRSIHCHEETDEVGADEPYALVTAVNLASSVSVAGFPVPLPAFDVVRYGFDDVDDEETHDAPGSSLSFWGINGLPAPLTDPENAIFVVGLMENDDGDPEALRGVVKGVVGGSVLGSLTASREDKVAALIRDIDSAMGTPTGAPNFDDKIGIRELRFSADELRRAEAGEAVRASIDINGDGGRYELTFEARNPGWQGFELAPAGSASASGSVASVSRVPGSMELWYVGADGSVQDRFWYEGANWQGFELAPAGSASTTGSITAVSRIAGSMELWWIGADGSVQGAYWYEGANWQRYELAPAGSASTSGSITAVSRIPGSMELWYVGANGSVRDHFWYEGANWQGFELAPPGSASTTGSVTAVSRIPGSME